MNTSMKKRTYVFCTFSRSQYNSRTCFFFRKSFPCLVLHQTDKTLKAVIFSSGRLLHPPSTVLPICLRTARARPTKILTAVTFNKNVLGFNPHQIITLFLI